MRGDNNKLGQNPSEYSSGMFRSVGSMIDTEGIEHFRFHPTRWVQILSVLVLALLIVNFILTLIVVNNRWDIEQIKSDQKQERVQEQIDANAHDPVR